MNAWLDFLYHFVWVSFCWGLFSRNYGYVLIINWYIDHCLFLYLFFISWWHLHVYYTLVPASCLILMHVCFFFVGHCWHLQVNVIFLHGHRFILIHVPILFVAHCSHLQLHVLFVTHQLTLWFVVAMLSHLLDV